MLVRLSTPRDGELNAGPWPLELTSLLLFSLVQVNNWLWGYALMYFLVNALMVAAATLLYACLTAYSRAKLVGALGLCGVASFSMAQGTFTWFAVLPSIALLAIRSGRTRPPVGRVESAIVIRPKLREFLPTRSYVSHFADRVVVRGTIDMPTGASGFRSIGLSFGRGHRFFALGSVADDQSWEVEFTADLLPESGVVYAWLYDRAEGRPTSSRSGPDAWPGPICSVGSSPSTCSSAHAVAPAQGSSPRSTHPTPRARSSSAWISQRALHLSKRPAPRRTPGIPSSRTRAPDRAAKSTNGLQPRWGEVRPDNGAPGPIADGRGRRASRSRQRCPA